MLPLNRLSKSRVLDCILKESRVNKKSVDFPNQKSMDKYLKEHPNADPSNHKVVERKKTEKKKEEVGILNSLNPTGGVFTNYTPELRAKMPLGENITTLDKTMGKSADEEISIYRGSKGKSEIVAGDFITTNKQLAKDYAGSGEVVEKKVKLSDILDDKTEPLGEEYIYRPYKEEE